VIDKSVVLPCEPERAFAIFTAEISRWWPTERRHTDDPASRITLDEAGPFFEEAADGTTVPLGRVRAWEPPARLVLDFYPGTGPLSESVCHTSSPSLRTSITATPSIVPTS